MTEEHPTIRTGQGPERLGFEEFKRRFEARFYDPNFRSQQAAIDALAKIAWSDYQQGRKSPATRKAGAGFADPTYELSTEWIAARAAIIEAQRQHEDPSRPGRILIICGAPRNDKTCPGEMSKSYRMVQMATDEVQSQSLEADVLDLSHLTSEYGRVIYPCKGCVSTAMPLCHWPCSCYPNHSLDQVNDWMHEIYPRWVAAHGILIITPVHWYQAPTVLKLMMDRLVCADGGNPDPTSTHGKKPLEAKQLELNGWGYPRHLAGRYFAVIVHGDTTGTEALRHALSDWLRDMHLVPAGGPSSIDRLIGYYRPYATSHEDFDGEGALHQEVRTAARILSTRVLHRANDAARIDTPDPRPK